MKKLLIKYKNHPKIKFYTDFFIIFVFLQVISGIVLPGKIHCSLEWVAVLSMFVINLIKLLFFIYTFLIILNDAKNISPYFYKKVKIFTTIYILCSIAVSSFLQMRPVTLFSYIGEITYNYFTYYSFYEPVSETFKTLFYL